MKRPSPWFGVRRTMGVAAAVSGWMALAVALGGMTASGDDEAQKSNEKQISVTLKPEGGPDRGRPAIFRQLQPIRLQYAIKNGKSSGIERIHFNENYPLSTNFRLTVTKDGEELPESRYAASRECQTIRRIGTLRSLGPGDSRKGSFVVNLMYDMTALGAYEIRLKASFSNLRADLADPVETREVVADPVLVRVEGSPL